MKSWRRPFDSRSCQPCSRQFYFLPVLSHCHHPPLSLKWMSWVVPPPQGRLLPPHTGACCFRGTTCRSSGVGKPMRCWERSQGPRFPHGKAGAAARVYSSLIFGYRGLPQKLSTNPKVKLGTRALCSFHAWEQESAPVSQDLTFFRWLWLRVTTKTKVLGFYPVITKVIKFPNILAKI